MKQFLVLLAVLPLTLIVMMEFVLDTSINSKLDAINDVVYVNKRIAAAEGTFKYVIDDLRQQIAIIAGVDVDEVDVSETYTGNPKSRLSDASIKDLVNNKEAYLIHCKISVPIKEMKALGELLSSDHPKSIYLIDSYFASDYIGSAQ